MSQNYLFALSTLLLSGSLAVADQRPNILIAISDDQSYPHTSAYGYRGVQTPAFDRIAREGILFRAAFCASPGCSPSRAALLTGRHHWQLEHAGTHASQFPAKYAVFPDLLESAGYSVGYTGKGWGPGNWQISGRRRNPAGPAFRDKKTTSPAGVSSTDYTANFADFLAARPADRPFCFWYGAHEPHRGFGKGSGQRAGKQLDSAEPPPFLPDKPEIRADLLDYCFEIEHFDQHLARMLQMLDAAGDLDNTLIIVTSDNGMAFPRAKANCYEYGIHVPLAIRWPKGIHGSARVSDDLVGFVDLTATILDVARVTAPQPIVGRSLSNIFDSVESGVVDPGRDAIYAGRERHSSSRYQSLAYPQRALRTRRYLLVRNFRPDRWPAGAPRKLDANGRLGPMHAAYHDIDACPSLSFLINGRDDPEIRPFFHLAVDKRPAEELFDILQDPGCLTNLADSADYAETLSALREQLEDYLRDTGDPRILDGGNVFETYKRFSPIRRFPKPESP